MKKLIIVISALSATFVLTGCLVTRDQVREGDQRREVQQQAVAMQQARYQDMEEELREMKGRVASLENALNMSNSDKQNLQNTRETERQQMESRLKVYEEALTKMEQQYLSLSQKLESMQSNEPAASASSGAASTANGKKGKLGTFEQAEEDMQKKNFRMAIVNYQKYREANSKGKNYAEATYKMGVAFQELKMKDEAIPFFNEVVEKYPKSKSAEKAKIRLRQMK